MKRRFTCFESFGDVLARIPDQRDRERLAYAILDYGINETEPELEFPLDAIFESLRGDIDNSANAQSRNRGGRPRKTLDNSAGKRANDEEQNGGYEEQKTGVSENGKPKPNQTKPNQTNPNQDIPKKKRGAARFVPPTVEEVRDYCAEKGYAINPEHFVDFYASKGWMVGRNKMKDWKASVRTWVKRREEEREKDGKKVPTSDFSEYDD